MPVGSSDPELRRLVDEHPLAWVVSDDAAKAGATLLPMLAEPRGKGPITSLLGHFAKSNPQLDSLRNTPRASILFLGPHAYVSPEYVSKPGWGPTWNYASARFDVDIEFLPNQNDFAVERLVEHMERDRREPWTTARMGERYQQLIVRIVAFRAHVRAVHTRFKLAQDESDDTLAELLSLMPDTDLVAWMRRHNAQRLK